MHIVVLHNAVSAQATADEQDVLQQVAVVSAALRRLGHTTATVSCSLDLETARRQLLSERPAAVFNLVEALGGTDRLAPLATLLLEALGLPFTGASSLAWQQTNDKVAAKRTMRAARLPTPDWLDADSPEESVVPGRFLLKAVGEHASWELTEASLVTADGPRLHSLLQERATRLGRPFFAERFVDGREFNLSLLANPHADGTRRVTVLPPAEIDFSAFPPGKPRLVGYEAKWADDTFEYQHTPRGFDFPDSDAGLLDELRAISAQLWSLFGLRGYARVDFRVDGAGRPWVLEVNANPCLSPDAGFAAALQQAGLSFDEAVRRIVADANGAARGSFLTETAASSSAASVPEFEPDPLPLTTCPECGGELIEVRAKRQCARCHRICETCCEGGRG